MVSMLNPVSFFKKLAVSLSVVTMCISPLAQAAEARTNNQRKLIAQYLKETGLTTKKQTVGEFWKMVRHVYPPKMRAEIDTWVMRHRHEMMPKIEASTFKDGDNKEQVRLTLINKGQTMSLTFTGNEEKPLKVNGVTLSKKDLSHKKFPELMKFLASKDPSMAKSLKANEKLPLVAPNFVLTYKEFRALPAQQKAEYLVSLRYAAEAAQKVFQTRYGLKALNELNSKHEYALRLLFGNDAQAAQSSLTGKPCIVAGYISKYGENGSCGGNTQGAADLNSQMSAAKAMCSGGVSCNPLVYGFDGGGNPYCVPKANVKYATRECNKASPLNTPQDKKRIVESYLKKIQGQDINLTLNEEGKIPQEQYDQVSYYFTQLQDYITIADRECGQSPLKDIQVSREDQVSACTELRTRAFSLQAFAVQQPPPPPPAKNCDAEKAGSYDPGDGSCVCPDGTIDGDVNGMPACVVAGGGTLPGGKDPVVEKKENNWGWLLPIGLGVAAIGIFWWLTKDSGKTNEPPPYIPPQPPVEPTPSPSPTTPIEEPPCAPPNTLIGGVCTPPVVVPPPDNEGGSVIDQPGRGGGVR